MKVDKLDISCKDVMKHVCENLGEDFDSPKCKELIEHLKNCDDCKHYFHNVEDTIKMYKNYTVKMPKETHEKLMKCLGLDDLED